MNTTSAILRDGTNYSGLQFFYEICANYLWIVPVVCGIPGNILALLVANRKHNKNLSPCIYITAMALADTLFLVGQSWFMPLIQMTVYFHGLGNEIPYFREYAFK
jgi:hypothetical protein